VAIPFCTDQFVAGAGLEAAVKAVGVAVAGPVVLDGPVTVAVVDGPVVAGAAVGVGAVVPELAPVAGAAGDVLIEGLVDGLDPGVAEPVVPLPVLGVGTGAWAGAGPGAQGDVGVPGKELGTCSTSPGWKLADMIPLPAGPSVSPSTWPSSWRTTVSRSMCAVGASDGKSTPHPQPAALLDTVIAVPFVSPSSRPGSAADVTLTQARSPAGTIADQSEMACEVAVASSASATAVVTGVGGADAAVESIGFADVLVVELDELVAGALDGEVVVPDDAEPVGAEELELVSVVVLVDPAGALGVVELGAVELDEAEDGEPVVEVPVEVVFDEEDGAPTVTVCVVLVPLVVVVVVPLLVWVVVVLVLVVDVGHDTVCACITTPGPKLQLLVAGLLAPGLAEPGAAAAGDPDVALLVAGPLATGVMVIVLVTVTGTGAVEPAAPGRGAVDGAPVGCDCVDGLAPAVPVVPEAGFAAAPDDFCTAGCPVLAKAGTEPAVLITPSPAKVTRAMLDRRSPCRAHRSRRGGRCGPVGAG